jgi:peptidyl-prolyl cis-trans isomerase A (cyclophilin A)
MSTSLWKVACLLAVVPLTAPACASAGPSSEAGNPVVTLVTELGDITLEIYESQAPQSAGSFLQYVDEDLYQDAGFYRVVSPENDNGQPVISVIQGGLLSDIEPLSPVPLETTKMTGILHQDGAISLARGAPASGSGAAFFICIGAQPSLDFGGQRNTDGLGFAAFGKVIEGMDVVLKIHGQNADGPSDSPYTQGQMLVKPVRILEAYRQGRSDQPGRAARNNSR